MKEINALSQSQRKIVLEKSINFIVQYVKKHDITIKHILEPSCGSCEFIKYIYYVFDKFESVDGVEFNKKIYDSLTTENDKVKRMLASKQFYKDHPDLKPERKAKKQQ